MDILIFSTLIISVLSSKSIIGEPIHYGSLIRIQGQQSRHYLHSHKVQLHPEGPYSVTGFWADDDANSLWSIQQAYSTSPYSQKSYTDILKCGDNITLIHSLTGASLQTFEGSNGLTLPQQFLSNSNQALQSNNNWMVECVDQSDEIIKFGTKFRLIHINSNRYVRISKQFFYDDINCGRGCMIKNQLQVHATRERNQDTVLAIKSGITLF